MGSVYARLGSKVEVIEFQDRILPGMDLDCAKELQKSLKGLGITFHLSHSVTDVKYDDKQVKVSMTNKSGEQTTVLDADYCLIFIGRRPYTDGLELEKAGVEKDEREG